jgi:hypothetical protein
MSSTTQGNKQEWHRLETDDLHVVTRVYDAAKKMTHDIEWADCHEGWGLEVFCSQTLWRDLLHRAQQSRIGEPMQTTSERRTTLADTPGSRLISIST